jgi:Skp family chaperone for outer membrane proteins
MNTLAVAAVTIVLAAAMPANFPKNVTIAVAGDESVTITADGKRMSCHELNALYSKVSKLNHKPLLDCKLVKIKIEDRPHKQK